MSETYKVWVSIERIIEEDNEGQYDDMGLPDPLDSFDTFEEACAFVRSLPGWLGVRDTSDFREKEVSA